jgi:RNA-directed DNA polymerase
MQAKLHRWAAADPGRRFDDLFKFVQDPATLMVVFSRVAATVARTLPASTALRSLTLRRPSGCPGLLDGLRWQCSASRAEFQQRIDRLP